MIVIQSGRLLYIDQLLPLAWLDIGVFFLLLSIPPAVEINTTAPFFLVLAKYFIPVVPLSRRRQHCV
jgi:hypothetical protein